MSDKSAHPVKTARLTDQGRVLIIRTGSLERRYTVEDLQPVTALHAYRLQRIDKPEESYDIWLDDWGLHCDCGDSIWRKRRGRCKHAASLVAVGLIPMKGKP